MRPSFASIATLEKQEGAGKAGCALHPLSRVQLLLGKNAHEHTGSAEAIRPSLRNGFTAYNALSPVTGLSCHRRLRSDLRKLDASVGASSCNSLKRSTTTGNARAIASRTFLLEA